MKKYIIGITAGLLVYALMILVTGGARAMSPLVWDQGFETDTAGWFDDSTNPGYGIIDRVPSGENGVISSDGDWHANIIEEYPFSRFDGYRATWSGTWIAEIDVYLDTDWGPGGGFDYSVASNGSDGNHQRDFIFHITKDSTTEKLLIGASNNTNFDPREDLEGLTNHYEVLESGWYTLRHTFRNDSGVLAVDMQLVDSDDNVLWTEIRSDPTDTIPGEVGGNRYSWFTAMSEGLDLAIDNHQLFVGRSAEITSPFVDEHVFGIVSFDAILMDPDGDDSVQWAVRKGTCAAGTDTVFGNVDGFTDDYDWDGEFFHSEADVSSWDLGSYCFVFNPSESAGDTPIRLTREFEVVAEDAVSCKKEGWMSFANPSFRNQGDCVSYFQSSPNATGNKKDN